jgi:iron complex transport system substrate-binding protein
MKSMERFVKKIIIFICLSVLWSPLISSAATSIEVIDMAGRHVTAPLDPGRILCLGPGTLRLIVYLQAESKVVGVEDMEKMNPGGRPYWIAHPELHKLPGCGPGGPSGIGKKPDLEIILSLRPDAIFTTYMEDMMADDIQKILGIPVIVLSYGEHATFDEAIYKSLLVAGRILNREKRAGDVVKHIESLRKDMHDRTMNIPDETKPAVYVGGIGYRGSYGIESSEQSYIPFKWLNVDNVAERVKASTGSHVFMNKEMLLKLNPEIIFIDGGGLALVKDDYSKKPDYYRALSAFSRQKVYVLLPFNWYATNVGTALADAYAIGKLVYPEKFKDIDPESKADEIYTFLLGAPVYKNMKKDYGPIGQKALFK